MSPIYHIIYIFKASALQTHWYFIPNGWFLKHSKYRLLFNNAVPEIIHDVLQLIHKKKRKKDCRIGFSFIRNQHFPCVIPNMCLYVYTIEKILNTQVSYG